LQNKISRTLHCKLKMPSQLREDESNPESLSN